MSEGVPDLVAFAGYRLDGRRRQLRGPDGAAVLLNAKAFDVLAYLIAHRGRVVDKEELLREVWAGRVVEENNLTQAISAIRRALGAGAGDHDFIVTVPRRGYRFVAPVEPGVERRRAPAPTQARIPTHPPQRRQRIAAGTLAVVLGLAAMPVLLLRPDAAPPRAAPTADACGEPVRRDLLVARHALQRYTAERAAPAHAAVRRALADGSACAQAYATLAELYLGDMLAADGDPRTLMPLATAAAARAAALEPGSPAALVAQGRLALWRDRNPQAAERAFAGALERDPGNADAMLGRVTALHALGRSAEAERLAADAALADPLSPIAGVAAAGHARGTHALHVRTETAAAVEPDYWLLALQRGAAHEDAGRMEAARAEYARAVERSGRNSRSLAALARSLAHLGRRGELDALLAELAGRKRAGHVSPTMHAAAHAAAGDHARALGLLAEAERIGDPLLATATRHRSFAGIAHDPRFRALQQRLRRPATPAAHTPAAGPAPARVGVVAAAGAERPAR